VSVTFVGIDCAMNHSAFVELNERGEMVRFCYTTDQPSSAKKHDWTYFLKKPAKMDQETWDAYRLDINYRTFSEVLRELRPSYAAIEGYAFDQTGRAYQIGETCGALRRLLWGVVKIPHRVYDPSTLKMFAAHQGNCEKTEVADAVERRWACGFGEYNNTDKNRQTELDLADAYTVAKILWTEWLLRHAMIGLGELDPKEIQVFQRVTKANPTNLLARDWILPPGAATPGPTPTKKVKR
jgi:Holliday junction resolvasome RuvABC endonuclease subunit